MKQIVYLVGIGMGDDGTLTMAAKKAIEESTIVIGASRMLETANRFIKREQTKQYKSYLPKEIASYLRNEEFEKAAVVLSGDIGFYSGAKKLMNELSEFDIQLVPGITSMVYFCSKLKIPWENISLGSAHGKSLNLIQRIQRYEHCFFLLDGQAGLNLLCEKLIYYGMEHVILHVGERLSYLDEQIWSGTPEQIKECLVSDLVVVVVENKKAKNWVARTIPDSEFIRAKVPMTKEEVRTVSVGKLHLTDNAVVYDVGAGSGSVSIEIALQAPDIKVYAIEKKEEALDLMAKNKRKFAADNIEIISGVAPDVLEELPVPTHVFIGGSSGNLEEILAIVFKKNPHCRVVVNTIALNSIAQVMRILEKYSEYKADIVQLQSSSSKQIGGYQLMIGQNPIYIVTMWKE